MTTATITLTIEREKLIVITGNHGGHRTGRCVVCGAHGWLGKIDHGGECPVGASGAEINDVP